MTIDSYQGNEALRQASGEDALHKGMRRLHSLVRLQELGAPAIAVETAQRAVRASREELKDRFVEVEALLPLYTVWAKEQTEQEIAWQLRCEGCTSWISDAERVVLDEKTTDAWCSQYTFSGRTYPDPCPEFKDLGKPN